MKTFTRLRRGCCSALVVAVLVGGCGGGDGEEQSACDKAVSGPTTLLTYEGRADLDAVVPMLCERLDGLDIDHRVQREGGDRVVIEVPAADGSAAEAVAAPDGCRSMTGSRWSSEPMASPPAEPRGHRRPVRWPARRAHALRRRRANGGSSGGGRVQQCP